MWCTVFLAEPPHCLNVEFMHIVEKVPYAWQTPQKFCRHSIVLPIQTTHRIIANELRNILYYAQYVSKMIMINGIKFAEITFLPYRYTPANIIFLSLIYANEIFAFSYINLFCKSIHDMHAIQQQYLQQASRKNSFTMHSRNNIHIY